MAAPKQTDQSQAAAVGHLNGTAAGTGTGASAGQLQQAGQLSVQQHQSQATTKQVSGGHSCCAGCRMPIRDRFIFSVIEQNFHQECVRCSDCSAPLNERCFSVEGKLYCRLDYWRRYGPKCSACQEPIKPTELVQRLKERLVYHLDCFVCQDCKRPWNAGDQLHLIDEHRLLCKHDYLAATGSSNGNGIGNKNATSNGGGATAPAKQRHHLIHHPQTQQLHPQHHQQQPGATTATLVQQQRQQQHQQHQQANQENLNLADAGQLQEAGGQPELDDLDDLDELDDRSSSVAEGDQASMYASPHYGGSLGSVKSEAELSGGGKSVAAGLTDCGDELVDANGKRRGPRTTIKPKQLDTLRRAFESAPKPSRHIREQLAAETGLNMRVIQVWFQNRRSKERRMKNSNGSARRNFFRSSSRRLRVGPAASGANPVNPGNGRVPAQGGTQQQSLIVGAGGRGNKQSSANNNKQQQPTLESLGCEQVATISQQQQGSRGAHNSPSEFGGSSSGGFTYFSDSSNQADAFAINTGAHQQSAPQKPPTNNPQQQYLVNTQDQQATLMTLESPVAANQPQGHNNQQQYGGQHQSATNNLKNAPSPAPNMFQTAAGEPLPQSHLHTHSQPPPHLIMSPNGYPGPQMAPLTPLSGHPHHQSQIGSHSLVVQPGGPAPGLGVGGLMGGLMPHPQAHPSVVQW